MDRLALGGLALGGLALERLALERLALERLALERLALERRDVRAARVRPLDDAPAASGTVAATPVDPRRYVLAWIGFGIVALAWATLAPVQQPPATWSVAAVLLVATAVAEFLEVRLTTDETSNAFTLGESVVVVNLLMLPPAVALSVSLLGLAMAQSVRQRDLLKVAFNLGQVAVGMAAALAVLGTVARPDLRLDGPVLVAAGGGMVLYAVVNVVAMSGLVSILAHDSAIVAIRRHGVHLVGSIVGNTAVGILAAVVWDLRPELIVLLLAPLAAMYVSSRGTLRTMALVTEVRSEHARLERIVQNASDGIVLLDRYGRIELWSSAAERILGVPVSTAVGGIGSDVCGHPTMLALATTPSTVEETITRPDGAVRVVRAAHRPLVDDRGRVTGDVIVVHDVTRERETEALKADFVARVSHELRTPLTPIKGFAHALLDRGDQVDAAQRQHALASIAAQADELGHLIEDLLLVSRLTAQDVDLSGELSVEPVEVAELLDGARSWFATQHPERAAFVQDPAVPGARVLADPHRARQVLGQLLDNAVKFSPADSAVDVEVRTGDDGTVHLDVCDRGPGVPGDKREEIFEQFHRLEAPMRMTTRGAGIGLSIARAFAEAMDGAVTVTERDGGGSVFTFSLPTVS
ncbi:MAG: PAS domain-containing protein [Actinobacteria bacterium]|nr:PAS domain-containing protein [Actinomycetota bacterium]